MVASDIVPRKCSKPKGEYCRLHNPASGRFSSLEDVFKKADRDVLRTGEQLPDREDAARFQMVHETRVLDANIPAVLEEHVALSEQQLGRLSEDERKALSGYTGFAAGICNNVLLGNGYRYEYYEDAEPWRETMNGPCDFVSREDLVDYMETMDGILSARQDERRVIYRGTPIYTELREEIGDSVGKRILPGDEVGLVEGLKEYYKPGKVFKFDTYLSTTHSAYYAAERSQNSFNTKRSHWDKDDSVKGIVFELKTNAGVDVTASARHHAYEREVVLPRETYFKVVSVETSPARYDTVSGYDKHRRPDELAKGTYENIAAVVQLVEVDSEGRMLHTVEPHKPATSVEKIVPE